MAGKKWLDSEFIIWKCETRDELKEQHPDWTKEQVESHLAKIAKLLFKQGSITEKQLLTVG